MATIKQTSFWREEEAVLYTNFRHGTWPLNDWKRKNG